MKNLNIKTYKQFTDITTLVNASISRSSVTNGIVNVFSKHTTCGLCILENELLSLSDILDFLDTFIPATKKYRHDCVGIRDVPVDERVNGVSHVRMLLFPSSLSVPFDKDGLCFGKWQRLFLVEMDWCTPFRERTILLNIIPNGDIYG